MKDNYTEIIVVLDRSGSMGTIWSDSIGGLKHFVKEQQKVEGECNFTWVAFDDRYKKVIDAKPIEDVGDLDDYNIAPRNRTALLDALGKTINETGARLKALDEADRPSKVIFLIITDGLENASREFTHQQIREMIQTQEKTYSWDFLYQGANQDAFTVGRNLGLRTSAVMDYAASSGGVKAAYHAASQSCTRGRAGGQSVRTDFTDDERGSAS